MVIMPANTQAILMALKMTEFQSMASSDWDGDAGVTKRCPRQALEGRNLLRHLVEQSLNGHESIMAGDVINHLVQELPLGPRVARRLDSFEESLHAAFDVGEATPLFGV